MANCVKCGSELKPTDKFCQKCGTLNIQPVKSRRWGWLPWVVALATAMIVFFLGGVSVLEIYRDNTGYYERLSEDKVTVSDAVNETFSSKLLGENTKFAYPEVSIRGKRTNTANNKIAKEIEKYREGREGDFAADYKYYVSEKVVSVVVEVCYVGSEDRPNIKYFVYNISLSNGRLLNNDQTLRHYGTNGNAFKNRVEKVYDSYIKTVNLTKKEQRELYNDAHLAEPFIGNKGHLCFATIIPKEDGDNEAVLFDSSTKKVIPGPIDLG
ncbi:MAG: zinc ribbon domain-containing protein [Saccharofermentans sp.]|nr:zinc ribbon domain-containing protein [Saccharofermentans sp.]